MDETQQRCEQCGRIGTRGFMALGSTDVFGPIIVCANKNACRKRWPKQGDEEGA